MIIGINGYAGSGKDTIGTIIQYLHCHNTGKITLEEAIEKYRYHEWWLEDQSGWEIKKWAGKLKTIASLLTGIPEGKFEDQEFKKTNLGKQWSTWEPYESNAPWVAEGEKTEIPMTVRDFLQKLGTDACRNGLHTNTWVNALMADYTPITHSDRDPGGFVYPNWIITDTRFPNEAQAIKDAGGIIIRVDRPGVKAINAHPSETGLDDWEFDHKIWNGSDLLSLMFTVHSILKNHNLFNAKNQTEKIHTSYQ